MGGASQFTGPIGISRFPPWFSVSALGFFSPWREEDGLLDQVPPDRTMVPQRNSSCFAAPDPFKPDQSDQLGFNCCSAS